MSAEVRMYHGLLRLAVLAEAEGEVADGLRARLDRHGLIEREGVVLVGGENEGRLCRDKSATPTHEVRSM
jgi:hypothetical protein